MMQVIQMIQVKKTKLSGICVLIILCMLGSMVLTSCNSGASVEFLQANRKPVTLTLLTIVEDSTTPEAIAAVEKALNDITESRFTTRIKLIGLSAAEYEEEIARRFEVYDEEQEKLKEEASIQASLDRASRDRARIERAAGITAAATKRPTEPPKTTELYTERIVWPDTTKNQIDIFLITSAAMFAELVDDDRLESMEDELGTKAKILKEYIHPSIMLAGQSGGRTFAIPTNKAIGTATYLAVNKNLVNEFNAAVKIMAEAAEAAAEAAADDPDFEPEPVPSALVLDRIREYQHLTDYLEWVKNNKPGVALIEGPLVPLKNYEPLFPDMPYFPAVSNLPAVGANRPLVYTPEQEPTEPPTPRPTAPPTNEDGELITADPASTTIPGTTAKPRNIPAATTLAPANISITNMYTHAAFVTIANLNQEFREKGLFEASPVAAGRERAAYIIRGTLEDQINAMNSDLANGFEYEYILYGHPIASKVDLQSAMYGISVSSKIPVMRCMEIITMLNTNKLFKNTFTYGVLGTHYIYDDDGRIERINNEYVINMDYTGNHFIADLAEGDNPNKWEIAKTHNLNVVNSVFINFNFDESKFTADVEETIPDINALGERLYAILIGGNIPSEYEDIDDYIAGYVDPEFAAAGWADLNTEIRAQTNPPS